MNDRDLPAAKAKPLAKPRRKAPVQVPFAAAAEAPVDPVGAVEHMIAVQQATPAPVLTVEPVPAVEPAQSVHNEIEAATSPALDNDVTEAVAATTAVSEEGIEKMATIATPTPTEATDKAQAMFGDMSNRFKSAFEKSTKINEEMVELAKGNVEALVASARVAAKGGETLGQEAAEYGKKSLENAVALFKSVASVKSPTELFQLQSDYAKSSFDTAVAEASKFSEALLKIAGEVAQPLSTRYAIAAEKIKTASL